MEEWQEWKCNYSLMNTQELSEELTTSQKLDIYGLQILHLISFNQPCVISYIVCTCLKKAPLAFTWMDQLCGSYVLACYWFCQLVTQVIQALITSTCLLLRPVLAADCHGLHLRPSADPVPGWGLVHCVCLKGDKGGAATSTQGLWLAGCLAAPTLSAILNFVYGSLFRKLAVCIYSCSDCVVCTLLFDVRFIAHRTVVLSRG